MGCSITQKGSNSINRNSSPSLTPQLFGYLSKVITENPYQLPPEFMILKKHLVSFPLHIFVRKTADFPSRPQEAYFGNKSTSYLSRALLDRTSRHKFLQMQLQGSRTTQTTCPIHTENFLQVCASS